MIGYKTTTVDNSVRPSSGPCWARPVVVSPETVAATGEKAVSIRDRLTYLLWVSYILRIKSNSKDTFQLKLHFLFMTTQHNYQGSDLDQ